MFESRCCGKSWMRIMCLLMSISFMFEFNGYCESKGGGEVFDYPELSSVPRSSERLQIEASKESRRVMTTFIPIQLSSLTTAIAGLMAYDAALPDARNVGLTVGGATLAISTILSLTYRPYGSAHREVSPLPKGTTREQLTRERLAEEQIKDIADFGNKVKWISFASNFGASVYMLSKRSSQSNKDSTTLLAAELMSTLLSFAPLAFPIYWGDVYEEQNDYKKRIYAPVARGALLWDSVSARPVPGLTLSLNF